MVLDITLKWFIMALNMQICNFAESYAMMKDLLGMSHEDISKTFKEWNAGELESYLIEITGDIFTKLDDDNEALVEKILDTAGQRYR